MANAVREAQKVQVGLESTDGTAVAATRRLLLDSATYRQMQEMEEFEDQEHGTLARAAVAPTITREHTELELATKLDFEQILLPLLSGVRGGVSPTTPGSGEARLYTFTPAASADPAVDTYTLEFAESDFTNDHGKECPYGVTSRLGISAEDSGVPDLSWSMFGRKTEETAPTGALAIPAVNYAPAARFAVYFDSTWANLGNTQITGQIYGFRWSLETGQKPTYFLDNRANLDFSRPQFGTRVVDLQIDAVIDPNSGLVPDEDDFKVARTPRFVRIELTGGAFSAPDNGLNRFVRLDGAYVHAPDSLQEFGSDRDGNSIVSIHLKSIYDATSGNDLSVAVQNNLTSFP